MFMEPSVHTSGSASVSQVNCGFGICICIRMAHISLTSCCIGKKRYSTLAWLSDIEASSHSCQLPLVIPVPEHSQRVWRKVCCSWPQWASVFPWQVCTLVITAKRTAKRMPDVQLVTSGLGMESPRRFDNIDQVNVLPLLPQEHFGGYVIIPRPLEKLLENWFSHVLQFNPLPFGVGNGAGSVQSPSHQEGTRSHRHSGTGRPTKLHASVVLLLQAAGF